MSTVRCGRGALPLETKWQERSASFASASRERSLASFCVRKESSHHPPGPVQGAPAGRMQGMREEIGGDEEDAAGGSGSGWAAAKGESTGLVPGWGKGDCGRLLGAGLGSPGQGLAVH